VVLSYTPAEHLLQVETLKDVRREEGGGGGGGGGGGEGLLP